MSVVEEQFGIHGEGKTAVRATLRDLLYLGFEGSAHGPDHIDSKFRVDRQSEAMIGRLFTHWEVSWTMAKSREAALKMQRDGIVNLTTNVSFS